MSAKRFSNLVGFDDGPFKPDYTGPVKVVGTVFTSLQLTGVLMGQVEKDGADAAEKLAQMVAESRFAEHLQLVMLQGIAWPGLTWSMSLTCTSDWDCRCWWSRVNYPTWRQSVMR